MALTKIHLLPFFTFSLIPSAFIITYCLAIHYGHVEIDFPYISDTGTSIPESCIFSQLINIVAVLLAATMYVRYKLIEQHYRDHLSSESTTVLRINLIAIIVGWIGCTGVSVLANFQETSVLAVHITGAFTAFACATVYCWLHTIISYYVCPLLNSRRMVWTRFILSLIVSVSCFTTIIPGFIAHNQFHGNDPKKWRPDDGGFVLHVVSTASEWVLVMAFDFYVLTLGSEMKKVAIASPQVLFILEDQELESNDYYSTDDRLNITQSQSSLKANSAPPTPYGTVYGVENSMMTTQAIIH